MTRIGKIVTVSLLVGLLAGIVRAITITAFALKLFRRHSCVFCLIAALCFSVLPLRSQECESNPAGHGGTTCKAEGAVCSPVTDGSGTRGKCTTERAGGQTCECKGGKDGGGSTGQIQFVITTGDDDLRGDSSATATLQDVNGSALQVLTLKAESDPSWDGNTTHTILLPLNVQQAASKVRNVVLTLTSHNGLFETDDNWNIQSVYVTVSQGGSSILANAAGNPLVRLTGSQPSITLAAQPNPPPVKASDVYFWR